MYKVIYFDIMKHFRDLKQNSCVTDYFWFYASVFRVITLKILFHI